MKVSALCLFITALGAGAMSGVRRGSRRPVGRDAMLRGGAGTAAAAALGANAGTGNAAVRAEPEPFVDSANRKASGS